MSFFREGVIYLWDCSAWLPVDPSDSGRASRKTTSRRLPVSCHRGTRPAFPDCTGDAGQRSHQGESQGGEYNLGINTMKYRISLLMWLSDAIWRHRSGSQLPQTMACCLTAPNPYLRRCWKKNNNNGPNGHLFYVGGDLMMRRGILPIIMLPNGDLRWLNNNKSCGIHLGAISLEIDKISMPVINLKITYLRLQLHLLHVKKLITVCLVAHTAI